MSSESSYLEFLGTKEHRVAPCGKSVTDDQIHPMLFKYQKAIVKWGLKRGRAAFWEDCGLGKTLQQLEWARLIGGRSLILAPLAVAKQTVEEAKKIGLKIPYVTKPEELVDGINITNYERLDAFDNVPFNSVVLDESSILKSFDGKTRNKLISRFSEVPYRLCCTATPAPNDYIELGNHAQFLGIMSWQEMAATFFVHDQSPEDGDKGGKWRLKGHAENDFWHWLVSWGVFVKRPSDIGYDDTSFVLPELTIEEHVVDSGLRGRARATHSVRDVNRIRRATMAPRLAETASCINGNDEQWIAWVGLNDEGQELARMIPGAVLVEGSDDPEEKALRLLDFAAGKIRVLVTKAKIAGFGMNLQNCHNMAFVGIGYSYESYYQCIRRCWRYGQGKPVRAIVVTSDIEKGIVDVIHEKEKAADKMSQEMVKRMSNLETQEIHGAAKEIMPYKTEVTDDPENGYMMFLGDCVEVMRSMPEQLADLSVYSPPFSSLYTYTNSPHDLGNSKNEDEFFEHFKYFVRELLRVTKDGRLTVCHVSQLPAMLSRDGFIGMKDFRGRVIETFKSAGWIHHGEVVIDKNPQAQAIRTKSKSLLFVQLRKDASWMRPALCDFLLVFRKPGENAVPVKPTISNDDWIRWAHPIWYDIRESDTLKYAQAREESDEKHICPLQLGVIDRAVQLWSNQGELVLSPFGGIGSEGYQALLRGRQYVGIELKESYYKLACQNLKKACEDRKTPSEEPNAAAGPIEDRLEATRQEKEAKKARSERRKAAKNHAATAQSEVQA